MPGFRWQTVCITPGWIVLTMWIHGRYHRRRLFRAGTADSIISGKESCMHGIRAKMVMMVCALAALASAAAAGQLVSTMRNVSAVMSSNGYTIRPVPEMSGKRYPGDVGPSQMFEIVRPNGEAITLGRLNTSCVCVQISTEKKSYGRNERAFVEMRNVKPTPPAGQRYALYVQLTRPVRITLRYDTQVRSGFDNLPEPLSVTTTESIPAAPSSASAAAAAAAQTRTATPSSTTSNPLTVVGDNGIEMIIPRWETEPEVEVKEKTTVAEQADGAPAITYSKEMRIEPAASAEKEDAPAAAPTPAEPAGEAEIERPWVTKEIKVSSAESALTPPPPAPRIPANRPEGIDQVIDQYAASYVPDAKQ